MNKKLVTLLLTLPLLAGCGTKVSKPAFKKAGEKVTFEKFVEELANARKENIFFNGEALPSMEASLVSKGSEEIVSKRGKHTLSSEKTASTIKMSSKLDVKNGNASRTQSSKSSKTTKTDITTNVSSDETSSTLVTQKFVKDEKEHAISVNEKAKYYIVSYGNQVSETNTYVSMLEKEALTPFATAKAVESLIVATYPQMSDEEKAEFAFYQNKKVFTVEFTHEEKNEEDKSSEKKVTTFQIDLSKNEKYTVLVYQETTEHEEVTETYLSDIKGDSTDTVTKASLTLKAAKKNVTVKPVKLTDKFAEYNYVIA